MARGIKAKSARFIASSSCRIFNVTRYPPHFIWEFSTVEIVDLMDPMPITIKSFRDLLVWQKAMDLSVRTYKLSGRLPRSDQTPDALEHRGRLQPPFDAALHSAPEEAAILIADAQEIGRMINGLVGSLERTR